MAMADDGDGDGDDGDSGHDGGRCERTVRGKLLRVDVCALSFYDDIYTYTTVFMMMIMMIMMILGRFLNVTSFQHVVTRFAGGWW